MTREREREEKNTEKVCRSLLGIREMDEERQKDDFCCWLHHAVFDLYLCSKKNRILLSSYEDLFMEKREREKKNTKCLSLTPNNEEISKNLISLSLLLLLLFSSRQ